MNSEREEKKLYEYDKSPKLPHENYYIYRLKEKESVTDTLAPNVMLNTLFFLLNCLLESSSQLLKC